MDNIENLKKTISRLQNKIKKYEKNFQFLIEHSSIPIIIFNKNFEPVYFNKSLIEIFKAEEVKKKSHLKNYIKEIFNKPDILTSLNKKETVSIKNLKGDILKVLINKKEIIFNDKDAILVEIIDLTELIKKEEALKESKERLTTLINAIPDIICFKDGEGRWLEANKADLELFCLENVNYFGKKDSELAKYTHSIYKEAFLTCEKSDEKAWEKGSLYKTEEIIKKPDGEIKIYDIIKVPIFNDDGTRKGLIVVGRDITELKLQLKYSERLNQFAKLIIKENNLNLILENALEIIGESFDADFLKIFHVKYHENKATLLKSWKNLNFNQEMVGRDNYPLSFVENLNNYILKNKDSYIISSISNPNPLIIKDNISDLLHKEFGIKTLMWLPLKFYSNEYYFVAIYHLLKEHKWKDSEINFLKSFANLIELAFMKIDLFNNYKRLAILVEQSKSMIIVTDINGKVEYVNKAFVETTGYSKMEIINKIPEFLLTEKYNKDFYQNIFKIIKEKNFWHGQLLIKRKNGEELLEDAIIFPLRNEENKIINLCKISRDITKERELEEQLLQAQKMEAIGKLAGGIAHDFNNILTVINGYAEILKIKLQDNKSLIKYVEQIYNSGLKAQNLINQILAFSRKQTFNPKIIDLNEIIKNSFLMFKRLIPEDIKLELELTQDLPKIKADVNQIEQILINLIVNAADAIQELEIPPAEKKIIISTTIEKLNEKSFVCFSVKDNGIGIPKEIQDKIFEPFFSTKPKDKGTGLGLSVVYGIVKQNKGEIVCNSKYRKGTEIKIYWPISSFEEIVESQEDFIIEGINYQTAYPISSSATILLVEDNLDVLNFLKEILEKFNFKVIAINESDKAIDIVKKDNLDIDLVISDVVMPKKDGFQLYEEFLKIKPDIKFLFISGYNDILKRKSKIPNNIKLIQKPIRIRDFINTINEILNKKGEKK